MMIRPSILTLAALAGLALLGALFFGLAPAPVEPPSPAMNNPVEVVAPENESPREGRAVPTAWAPHIKFANITDSTPDAVTRLIGDVTVGTNGVPSEFQAGRLQAFIEALSTNDYAAAFRQLNGLQAVNATATGRELQLRLLQRWAANDLPAAVLALDQLRAEDRPEAYERLAAVWAKQDLSAAIAWTEQLPEGAERQQAALSIAYEAAFTNPREALVLAGQMPVPPEKRDLISQAASSWAAGEPELAAGWAKQIQDQPLREQVLAAIATAWADQDPAAAAQLVLDSLSQGREQENAVLGIVQRLTFKNVEAAAAWVAEFPDGALRETALAEMNRILERRQLVAAPKL
jgi:hypothetical protein